MRSKSIFYAAFGLIVIAILMAMILNNTSGVVITTYDGEQHFAKSVIDSPDRFIFDDAFGRTVVIPKASVLKIVYNN